MCTLLFDESGLTVDVLARSMIREAMDSSQECTQISLFARTIADMLSRIVSTLQRYNYCNTTCIYMYVWLCALFSTSLLEQGLSIPRVQETLSALDLFLQEV